METTKFSGLTGRGKVIGFDHYTKDNYDNFVISILNGDWNADNGFSKPQIMTATQNEPYPENIKLDMYVSFNIEDKVFNKRDGSGTFTKRIYTNFRPIK